MGYLIKNGQTSVVLRFKLLDSSSSSGAGLTGLTNSSSGLIISTIADNEASATTYTAAGSTIDTIATLGTFAAPSASHCRFKEVDSTNHKGVYELQFADARFAVSSAKSLLISISGATNLVQADYEVQLLSDDPYVAKPSNFASLSVDGSGRIDVGKTLGQAVTLDANNVLNVSTKYLAGTAQTGRDIGANVLLSAGTGTGQLDFTSGVVKANVTQFGGSNGTFASGRPEVNTTHWSGTINATADTAGYPKVTIKSGTGTGEVSLSSGTVTVGTNNDKTGYTASTVTDKTGYALTSGERSSIATAIWTDTTASDFTTALSVGKSIMNGVSLGTGLTINDLTTKSGFSLSASGLSSISSWSVAITGNITGNLSGSVGSVTGNIGGNVTGSVGSISGVSFPTNFSALGIGSGGHILNVDTLTTYTNNTPQTGDAFGRLGAPAGASVSADIAAVKSDSGGIKTKTDSLTFTVSGVLDGNVVDWKGSTAPAMTGDAYARIGAAGAGLTALGDTRIAHLDADISSRLPTSSYSAPPSSSTIAGAVMDEVLDSHTTLNSLADYVRAGTNAAASANTAIGDVDPIGSLSSGIQSIKSKTDVLDSTVPGLINVNIKAVNDVTVTGDGNGTPWGPA